MRDRAAITRGFEVYPVMRHKAYFPHFVKENLKNPQFPHYSFLVKNQKLFDKPLTARSIIVLRCGTAHSAKLAVANSCPGSLRSS